MHQGVNFSGDALGPRLFCPVANKNRDGRHVGLDVYDLLIEALRTPPMSDTRRLRSERANEQPHALSRLTRLIISVWPTFVSLTEVFDAMSKVISLREIIAALEAASDDCTSY